MPLDITREKGYKNNLIFWYLFIFCFLRVRVALYSSTLFDFIYFTAVVFIYLSSLYLRVTGFYFMCCITFDFELN